MLHAYCNRKGVSPKDLSQQQLAKTGARWEKIADVGNIVDDDVSTHGEFFGTFKLTWVLVGL